MNGHFRETVTPVPDLLIPDSAGYLLADCSCGAVYIVTAGESELVRLDRAQEAHEKLALA